MRLTITDTTEFLWNTPFGLAIGISGHVAQTTSIEYYDGAAWVEVENSTSSTNFQSIIEAPSKRLRIVVTSPGGDLQVTLERRRLRVDSSVAASASSQVVTSVIPIGATEVTVDVPIGFTSSNYVGSYSTDVSAASLGSADLQTSAVVVPLSGVLDSAGTLKSTFTK